MTGRADERGQREENASGRDDRPKVGVALGGGVLRGMAHVGVLSVLRREGIPVDYLAGTSVGALIGALLCAGMEIREIERLASETGWRQLARPVWPRRGFVSFDRLERLLINILGDLQFSDLEIPFAAITTDLRTGEEVVLRSGRLAPAVHASAAVPGIVVPREIDGQLLGDGGVVNNLPASAVRAMGASYVIGVDIFEPSYTHRWGPLGLAFTALEILISRAGAGHQEVDCLIRPALAGTRYVLVSRRAQLIALGREAAEAVLPELQHSLANPTAG